MRLYLKLMVIICAFILLQRGMEDRYHDLWFACRCSYAWNVGDHRMQERLIEQARLELFGEREAVFMQVAAASGTRAGDRDAVDSPTQIGRQATPSPREAGTIRLANLAAIAADDHALASASPRAADPPLVR